MKRAGFVCDICGAEVESDAWNAHGEVALFIQTPNNDSPMPIPPSIKFEDEEAAYSYFKLDTGEICTTCTRALVDALNTALESRRNAH